VPIRYERRDAVAEIVLDRPGRLNALGLDDVTALRQAFGRATAEHARGVLLRAEGRAFCVGRDLTGLSDDEDVTETLRGHFNLLIRTIQACGIPTVAAVQGPCVGAGTGLALACDLVVAAESATFASPFGRLGAIPDSGFHWFVTTRLGPALARDMVLTGRELSGEQAASAGLVARCVADAHLLTEARALVTGVAAGPTTAFGLSLAIVDDVAAGMSLDEALEAEALGQGRAFGTADFTEGRAAFLDRRPPSFSGR
jgi:2-(1,2-epoxy-1,2-dihydrophenyl)acetyl-CoA isomerase